jgi:hypothetical protein
MSPVQVGWVMALSFILALVLIAFLWFSVHKGDFHNPFAPFIRAFERRQQHKHEMALIRLRAELTRKGVDPEYVKQLEKEARR